MTTPIPRDTDASVIWTGRRTENERLQLNQAPPRGVGDGFGPADHIHLGEDAFHMRLHRALTNKESRADLFVAFALRHQLEHVDLAFAQGFAADTLREFGGEVHWHTSFAGVHPANAIHQRFT